MANPTRRQLVGQIQRPGQKPENIAFFADERPVLTKAEQAAGIKSADGRYNPGDSRRYGAVFDGSTDDSTAHQAAIDVLEQMGGGTWLIADGTSKAQGLVLAGNHIHIDCRGILAPVSNASADSVLQLGEGNDDIRGLTGNLNLGGLSQTFSSWTNITGLDVRDLQESQLHVNVRGFGVGIAFTPDENAFVAYNNFFIGGMLNNKVDIHFDPTSSGAANENKFWGGRYSENSGTWVPGRTIIDIDDNGNNQVNHNVWISPSFESSGRLWDSVGGIDNFVLNARYEPSLTGTPDTDFDSVQVLMDSTSRRNHIHFAGGDTWFDTEVDHGAGTRVDDCEFTVASTDITDWCYPGAPIKVTVGGTAFVTFVQSSSFSTNTTVVVSLPVITGNPTAIETARIKISGDDNEVSGNALEIPAVETLSLISNPRTIASFERSNFSMSAINNTYPIFQFSPGSSDSNLIWQAVSLDGNVSSRLTNGGALRVISASLISSNGSILPLGEMNGVSVMRVGSSSVRHDLMGTSYVLDTTPSEFADDAAAASGGVVVGGIYRTGSALKVRVS